MNTIALPNTEEINRKTVEAVQFAKSMVISTNEEYVQATEFVKGLKKLEKEIKDTFSEPKDLAFKAHRSIVAAESKHLEPIQEATRILNPKVAGYLEEQDRKRREEEKRLQDEARKREEDERLATALQAEKEGQKQEAEAILSVPTPVPAVVLPKSTPKVDGTSMSYRYSAQVTDIMALIKFVAANPRYVSFLQANTVALNREAVNHKEALQLPGVQLVRTPVMAYRTK